MEKRKNIIYITGVNTFAVSRETDRWIRTFQERHDENNIDSYRIEEVKDWGHIFQDLQTIGIFATKRICIFSGVIKSKTDIEEDGDGEKAEKEKKIDDILIQLAESVSEDTFLIFSNIKISPKSPFQKWLTEHADIRRYDDIWDISDLGKRYPNLETHEIEIIIKEYKKGSIENDEQKSELSHAIGSSLEKISLIKESRNLKQKDYEASINLEASGKIFDLTDAIMRGDSKRGLVLFHNLIESMNIYAFSASFLGLMRTPMYVRHLKELGKKQNEITKLLPGASPFSLQKAYESRISYQNLLDFYQQIMKLNIAYRSGKGRKDPELGRIFDIELAIMGLKK